MKEDLSYLWNDPSLVLRVWAAYINNPTQEDTGQGWAGSQGSGQEAWGVGQGSNLRAVELKH